MDITFDELSVLVCENALYIVEPNETYSYVEIFSLFSSGRNKIYVIPMTDVKTVQEKSSFYSSIKEAIIGNYIEQLPNLYIIVRNRG